METSLQVVNNSETVSENKIIKSALTGTLVKSAIPYEVDGCVSVAVDKAIFYLGLKTIEEDRDMIKIAVIADVKRHFQQLTIQEIGIAIENGSKGKYGKVIGLSPKDIYDWLTAYSISEERKNISREIAKENDKPFELTDQQKENLAWDNMLNAWEMFKRDNDFFDYGNAVYTTLDSKGKINFTKEQKLEFIEQAKSELRKEYNPLNHVGNFVKMNDCKAVLADLETSDTNGRIIAKAKRIALKQLFSDLSDMGMDIKDLFIEKIED